MFTTNLFEIKIQQEELQRRASKMRLIKSLVAPKGSSSKQNKREANQAELIQEAEKVRLIRSLKENKSSSKGVARKIQGLINVIFLP